MKQAVGTSLLIIALNSLIGFTGDIGHFKIDWKFLTIITLVAIAGIFIGGFLAKKIEGDKLKKAFGWFVLVIGIYILVKEMFFNRRSTFLKNFINGNTRYPKNLKLNTLKIIRQHYIILKYYYEK